MAYIHSDIDTCDCGQVCKSCGQDTELHELYKLSKPGETIINQGKDHNHRWTEFLPY